MTQTDAYNTPFHELSPISGTADAVMTGVVRMKKQLLVCTHRRLTGRSPSCGARGAEAIIETLQQMLDEQGLAVRIRPIACLGRCNNGPNLRLAPGGGFYSNVSTADLPGILIEIKRFLAQETTVG